jgi:hypothetical protein
MAANRPDNPNANQTLTKGIIIGSISLFLILLIMIWGGGSPQSNPDYGDRFRIVNDSDAAKTRWVGEAVTAIGAQNEAVNAVRDQNAKILQRMYQLESDLKQAQNELKAAKEGNSTITVVQRGFSYPPIPANQTTGSAGGTSTAQSQPTQGDQQPSSSWADRFVSRNMGTSVDQNGVPVVRKQTTTHYQLLDNALKSDKTQEAKLEKKITKASR